MRNSFFLLVLVFVAFRPPCADAQDQQEEQRLQSIVWNVQERKLCIEVMIGKTVDGKFVLDRLDEQYCIDPDAATMNYAGETRGFDDPREQPMILRLLEIFTRYGSGSVEWWRAGRGAPVKRDGGTGLQAKIESILDPAARKQWRCFGCSEVSRPPDKERPR
jgi:hypothetical protein